MKDIKYRINKTTIESLNQFEWIKNKISLSYSDFGIYDEREIINLLNNCHLDHIRKLLNYINEYGKIGGEISKKILSCNDSFDVSRYLAELYLLVYLYEHHGKFVEPIETTNKKSHDITVKLNNAEYKIEIYTPGDFYGYIIFKRYFTALLSNLPIDIGYKMSIIMTSENLYHPNHFSRQEESKKWLLDFQEKIIHWINKAKRNDTIEISGPIQGLKIHITLNEIFNSWENRIITVVGPTSSVSTRLFFEHVKDDIISKHSWGLKIKEKLKKQQAGPASQGVIRILIINFILNDISCTLFNDKKYFQNLRKIIRYHAEKIKPYPPFEIIIPSDLDYICKFSNPIILDYLSKDNLLKNLTELGFNKI